MVKPDLFWTSKRECAVNKSFKQLYTLMSIELGLSSQDLRTWSYHRLFNKSINSMCNSREKEGKQQEM